MQNNQETELISNNETGKAWAAYILGQLYSEWPARVSFKHEEAVSATGVDSENRGTHVFTDLLLWLRQEGLISFERTNMKGAFSVSLTSKGMAALEATLDDSKDPIGLRLKKLATEAGSQVARAAITKIVNAALGAALGV